MKIAFIGTGYVGLVSGTCFSELGADVTCLDIDQSKIDKLNKGEIPIFEPGLKELVEKNIQSERLKFTSSMEEAIKDAEIVFIAVGTPTDDENGNADLSYVYQAAKDLAKYISPDTVIVTKSTVPVGTGKQIKEIISKERNSNDFEVVSNPEFLREGCAVNDFLYPDRIIIGAESETAKRSLEVLYKPLTSKGVKILFSDIQTAELTKYASNAFLATKIAFINEIADMCEKMDANVSDVATGIGMDHRIGENYLSPGPGYGGSCFPKDTLALQYMANQFDTGEKIVSAVISSNDQRKVNMGQKIIEVMGGSVDGKKIAVLGLAFKANTNDMRESPSIPIVKKLFESGANISAYDPEAMEEAKKELPDINYTSGTYEAIKDSEAIVIITEWAEFSNLDFDKVKSEAKNAKIIDLRNLYNPSRMKQREIEYYSVGRNEPLIDQVKLDLVSSS